MTLDKLLLISSQEWDKLTDAELTKILSPYFNVTRPDSKAIAAAKEAKATKKAKSSGSGSNLAELIRLAKEHGIVVPERKSPNP